MHVVPHPVQVCKRVRVRKPEKEAGEKAEREREREGGRENDGVRGEGKRRTTHHEYLADRLSRLADEGNLLLP